MFSFLTKYQKRLDLFVRQKNYQDSLSFHRKSDQLIKQNNNSISFRQINQPPSPAIITPPPRNGMAMPCTLQMGRIGRTILSVLTHRIPMMYRQCQKHSQPFGPPPIWMGMCGLSPKQEAFAKHLLMRRRKPSAIMRLLCRHWNNTTCISICRTILWTG